MSRRKLFALESTSLLALIIAAGPAFAQVTNPPPGETDTQGTNAVVDGTTAATTVNLNGGGTLILNNTSNTYSGGTYVNNGSTLQIDSPSELGSGDLLLGATSPLSAGTLSVTNATATTPAEAAITNNIDLAGKGGILIGGTQTYPVAIDGLISGTAPLTITGSGSWIQLGATPNSFVGDVFVTNGATLDLTSDYGLGATLTTTTAINGLTTTTATLIPNQLHLNNGTLFIDGSFSIGHNILLDGGPTATDTIDTDGNLAVVTSSVSDNGSGAGLTKSDSGVLVLDNVSNVISGGTTITSTSGSAGSLQIGDQANHGATLTSNVSILSGGALTGFGTVIGNVNNSAGTVEPGGVTASGQTVIGNLTINGTYTQASGGTLTTAVAPGGPASLTVDGTANLAGTFQVAYGTGFLHAGTYGLLTANQFTGSFSTITAGVPSVGLTETVQQTTNAAGNPMYEVILTQNSKLSQYQTVVPAITTASIEDAQERTGQILDHMEDVRLASYADNMSVANSEYHRTRTVSPYGYWFEPVGSFSSQSSGSGAPGLTGDKYGFITGYDEELLRGLSGGIAAGITRNTLQQSGAEGGAARIDTPHVELYSSYWRGGFALDVTAGAALPANHSSRPVLDSVDSAEGGYGSTELTGGLQASYSTRWDGWTVGTAVGTKFVHYVQSEFTETGPTLDNFFVYDHMNNSLRPYADVSVSRRFEIGQVSALIPQLRIGYEEEMMSGQRLINTMVQGDYYNWATQGLTPGKGTLMMSASVVLETSKEKAFYMTYDRYQSTTNDDQSISAGMRFRM